MKVPVGAHSCQRNAGIARSARPNTAGQQCGHQSSECGPWRLCRASGGISTSARSQTEADQDRPQHGDGLRVHPRMYRMQAQNEQDLRQLGTILKFAGSGLRMPSTVTVPDRGGSSRKGSDSLQFA